MRQLPTASDSSHRLHAKHPKCVDLHLRIVCGEDCVAGDESICSGAPYVVNGFPRNAAIDFEGSAASEFIQHVTSACDLVERRWNEFLSAETGIDRHHEKQVDIRDGFAH